MTTRYLIAAALLAGSACGAKAEVVSAAQSGFLSGWTGGNGTDVVSSGVLSNGVSLVGGAAYGSGNLAEALYQKASASVGQTGTQVKLSYSQGIEGTYLLSTSNAKLAAMLGNGKGVVSTADGKVVTDEGAGNSNAGVGGGCWSGAPAPAAPAANPSKGGNAPSAGDIVNGAPSDNYDNGHGATVITPAAGGQEGGAIVELPIPAQNGNNGNGNGNIGGDIGVGLPAAPAAAVPEPSSIALMMAGMLGAMGIVRRRKR